MEKNLPQKKDEKKQYICAYLYIYPVASVLPPVSCAPVYAVYVYAYVCVVAAISVYVYVHVVYIYVYALKTKTENKTSQTYNFYVSVYVYFFVTIVKITHKTKFQKNTKVCTRNNTTKE